MVSVIFVGFICLFLYFFFWGGGVFFLVFVLIKYIYVDFILVWIILVVKWKWEMLPW